MSAAPASVWPSRIFALLLATAVMGSAVAWGLKLRGRLDVLPLATVQEPPVQVDAAVVARALGAPRTDVTSPMGATLAASRMVLVGVVAGAAHGGSALIAVDGKPPKPVAVGARVGEDWVLVAVAPRRAVLRGAAEGSTESLTLEMPLSPTLLPKLAASP